MPDIKTIKRADYLRHQIRIASKAYYDDDIPIISDAAYDAMLLELRTLEEENPMCSTRSLCNPSGMSLPQTRSTTGSTSCLTSM